MGSWLHHVISVCLLLTPPPSEIFFHLLFTPDRHKWKTERHTSVCPGALDCVSHLKVRLFDVYQELLKNTSGGPWHAILASDSRCLVFFFFFLKHISLFWMCIVEKHSKGTNFRLSKAKMRPEALSHENDTATWKVMTFGNGKWESGGLFKSILCLLIPAVMYGLGSEMRCPLQPFLGNYRALTSKPASWRAQSRCLSSRI